MKVKNDALGYMSFSALSPGDAFYIESNLYVKAEGVVTSRGHVNAFCFHNNLLVTVGLLDRVLPVKAEVVVGNP